jgi:conjugative transposon TraK protein
MFTKTKNIDTAFRHIRLFTVAVIAGSTLLCCFALYKSYEMVGRIQGKIYILANGKALEAVAEERKDNIPVEARDHIKTFHRLFFTLSPDEKAIREYVGKSLYLADASAKKEYDNLTEKGFYTSVIAGNVSQQITVDSIGLDINQYPFFFRCYATQQITRTTSTVLRSLVTEGYLRNINRSDNNPHGFLIERWITVYNRDIKIENR